MKYKINDLVVSLDGIEETIEPNDFLGQRCRETMVCSPTFAVGRHCDNTSIPDGCSGRTDDCGCTGRTRAPTPGRIGRHCDNTSIPDGCSGRTDDCGCTGRTRAPTPGRVGVHCDNTSIPDECGRTRAPTPGQFTPWVRASDAEGLSILKAQLQEVISQIDVRALDIESRLKPKNVMEIELLEDRLKLALDELSEQKKSLEE